MYGIYQVSSMDTIDSIAKEIGSTVEELKKLNGMVSDMSLRPGSFLIVPKYDSSYEKYTVQKGDNMYAIARKYGVDYQSLLKLNGLDDKDYIYPNETILIPRGFKAYVTEEESLEDISSKLNQPLGDIISKNPSLIVKSDQVIRY